VVSNEIEQIIESSLPGQSSNDGYLVCESCNGYYQLQQGESSADFDLCECGGYLSYYPEIKQFSSVDLTDDIPDHNLKYDDLQKIIINLKNKAERRKELFEELSKKVRVQDELLDDIKDGKWSLWESIVQNNLHEDVKNQRKLLSDILDAENEDILNEKDLIDTVMKEEAKLMAHIHDKRAKLRNSKHWDDSDSNKGSNFTRNWDNDYAGVKISYVRAVAFFIILLIIIWFSYLFFVWILK
jgi:hypothetical protein